MKPFEFVLIIISVIVGLALTEFAIGVSFMIQHFREVHFYWPHFVFAAFGIVSLLNYWATLYRLRKVERWTVLHMGLVFMTVLIFFIITKISFPEPEDLKNDYETYFNANARTIFLLITGFLILWALEAWVIRKVRKFKKYLMIIVFVIMALSGAIINHPLYVGILGSVMLAIQLRYMYSIKAQIEERTEPESKPNT